MAAASITTASEARHLPVWTLFVMSIVVSEGRKAQACNHTVLSGRFAQSECLPLPRMLDSAHSAAQALKALEKDDAEREMRMERRWSHPRMVGPDVGLASRRRAGQGPDKVSCGLH